MQSLAPAEENCPHCGYAMAAMDEIFGSDEVLLERMTDAAEALSQVDRERVNAALDQFEQRFPQLFVAVYCGALPQQTSLRQFGFWLLNRAAIAGPDAMRPNENGALLILDTHGRSAALVPGYFMECYIDERDATRVLESARRELQRGSWATGLCQALDELTNRLRRRAAEAAKFPERFTPPAPRATPGPPRFTRIREGHTRTAGRQPAEKDS